MNGKSLGRHITDLIMVVCLAALMLYFRTGQAIHEWLGVAALVIFVLHHVWNRKWFLSLGKGRWTPVRVLQAALVLLLAVSMLAQIVSGLAMSREMPGFVGQRGPAWLRDHLFPTSLARMLHLACGYWTLLLSGLHLGLHWSIFLGLGRKFRGGRPLPVAGRWALRLAALAAALCGLFCFWKQGLPNYLFLRTHFVFFDYEQPLLLSVLEVLAIFALCVLAGFYLQKLALTLGRSKKKEGNIP